MEIGFIGLGVMGSLMASNFVSSGDHNINVFDIDKGRVEKLVTQGAVGAQLVRSQLNKWWVQPILYLPLCPAPNK